ncbi:MAG: PHP domain-containing protein [Dehalococcoidia bacterium]|nr:PHP domain-containing protein [Dehalococcoidia bacterium]
MAGKLRMLRADLHVHTYHSPDGVMRPSDLVGACRKAGITCVAVTDHHSIAGALEVVQEAPFQVIVGEEIKTSEGELIGLFLEEVIPKGLSPEKTISCIRDQKGLVLVPHPFDHLRRSSIHKEALARIVSMVDIIEVFNARIMLPSQISRARSLAAEYHLLSSGGSDAHTLGELGHGYVEMPEFRDASGFLRSLAEGKVKGRPSSVLVHVMTTWNRWKKKRIGVK